MAKLTLAKLERHLYGAADILRGKMDYAEFRGLILSFPGSNISCFASTKDGKYTLYPKEENEKQCLE